LVFDIPANVSELVKKCWKRFAKLSAQSYSKYNWLRNKRFWRSLPTRRTWVSRIYYYCFLL
jgi:hypothetical protein